MKQTATKITLSILAFLTITAVITITLYSPWQETESKNLRSELSATEHRKMEEDDLNKIEKKIARSEYFFRLLRDPKTNRIPPNARARELDFAKRLPDRGGNPLQFRLKNGVMSSLQFNWQSAGPTNIGGRTRALVVDRRNPSVVVAGGTSGGIWKSTDGGTTWDLKSDPTHNLSVTSLAQHPLKPDTLYYASGEFRGQSAADNGNRALYYGTGIFISEDAGETWQKIPETDDTDTSFNTPYDFISRIEVSPTTGSIFFASNGIGIYRVPDGGTFPQDTGPTPAPSLGTLAGHAYADVAVSPNGDLIAALSSLEADGDPDQNVSGANPGIFLSTDDGVTWSEITPTDFPSSHQRSVVAFAPSAPDSAYVLTYVSGSGSNEDVRLFLLDLNDGGPVNDVDYSNRIPDFGGSVGFMNTQFNYNMEVAVKPNDPNFVIVGGTNLFRIRDVTAPPPTFDNSDGAQKDEYWIGGYAKANDLSQYPGQHPDQHVVVFDPNDPDAAWAGHDGGLSRTIDIAASAVTWSDRNDGYVTTQFYAAAIPPESGDMRLMGGTQDNGTPFFRFDSQAGTSTDGSDIFGGDGGYAFFTPKLFYVSRQEGDVLRRTKNSNGDPGSFAFVHPAGASNQLFIHPYAVDPADEGIMYYPEGDTLWRNTQVDLISNNNNPGGVTTGWNSFQAVDVTSGFTISALEVSTVPTNILYYGASATNQDPKIFKLTNASSTTNFQNISIPGAASGSFVHNIAVNPADADEVLVIISNYGVPSIFHTTDGGVNWQDVEGNLSSSAVSGDLEPSVRTGLIVPAENGNIYLVGTSVGIYSASALDGANTQWAQEAPNTVGYAVTAQLALRSSDGTVAAGTHGRGLFSGSFQGSLGQLPFISVSPGRSRAGEEITITANNFTFNTDPEQNEVTFNEVPAMITNATPTELTVVVPRGTLPPGTDSNFVQIRVSVNGTAVNSSIEILPPAEFAVNQNFPNPFNPSTTIPFDLPERSGVIIQIYDLSGRKVLEPVREVLDPRTYNFQVDLNGLASGIYFYRVVAIPNEGEGDPLIETRKMTLIK